jgi:hypothetical protein
MALTLTECNLWCAENVFLQLKCLLSLGYLYSESGVYYCPESRSCSTLAKYRSFIDTLPLVEEPEVFGMHENADFAFQVSFEMHGAVFLYPIHVS